MRQKKGSLEAFSRRIKEADKKVIVYGAGVIGQIAAPYWFREYQMEEDVICYVDVDPKKQEQTVKLGSREVPIRPLSALEEECGRYILLVAVSAFEPVVQALEQIPGMRDTEVYFLPIMLVDIAHTPKKGGVVRSSDTQLIPKKIHYCWFSGNPIPQELQKCIDSWKRFCPDYELVRWDESNYDIHKSPYMEQAYAYKKWGFIPDYARLDILYQHGGIYLDTDVELIRNLDELLYQPALCGVEKWGTIAAGGGFGAQAENPVVKAMLEYRKRASFLCRNGTLDQTACGFYETPPLVQLGLRLNNETQVIANGKMTVYSSDFFLPFDYMSGETNLTENTFSIHHYNGSWLGENAAAERQKTKKEFKTFLEKLEG